MEPKDYITIVAVLLSPLLAVQAEKFIERTRNKKNRKVQIFKTLMATRGSKLSIEHVTALNQIDLEFYGNRKFFYENKKYKKVLNAWKEYFDQLRVEFNLEIESEFKAWNEKTEDFLANLLFEMGESLGYSFDKVTIKRNAYTPKGHLKVEYEEQQVRSLLIKILNGESSISTLQVTSNEAVERSNNAVDRTAELQLLLIEHYKNGKPINVKINKE